MTEIQPEKSAPTSGEIMSGFRIRDAVAQRIRHTIRADHSMPEIYAKKAAEKLIEIGYIDTAAVHRAIIDDSDDEGDDFLSDD